MWDQEKVHKAAFEELIVKHRVRPTALIPIWNVAGYLLGAGKIYSDLVFFSTHYVGLHYSFYFYRIIRK